MAREFSNFKSTSPVSPTSMSVNRTTWPPSFNASQIKPTDLPFYYSDRPTLLSGISDPALALAAPIFAYWSLSLFFHYLDTCGWKSLEKYRIHDSAEVKSRNLATRTQVVWAVFLQQIIQTLLGIWWISEDPINARHHGAKMEVIARRLAHVVHWALGEQAGGALLNWKGTDAVYYLYWWAVPLLQLLSAMFIIDTWQYFLHRLMHVNKFLYRQFHSVHHRLYVPYAFGSLYNHPVEGFVLDSLGAAMAESLTGMSTRQAMLLFSFSTFKTVDDHCGYRLPFDPLQMITGNNADYHDIHHQVIGIKSNFAQPFFVHWDTLLGTRMTRKDIELRRRKRQEKNE